MLQNHTTMQPCKHAIMCLPMRDFVRATQRVLITLRCVCLTLWYRMLAGRTHLSYLILQALAGGTVLSELYRRSLGVKG